VAPACAAILVAVTGWQPRDVGDDECWHVENVLPDGRGATDGGGDTEFVHEGGKPVAECTGASPRRPGNSQCEFGLVAVFMLSRLPIQASRSSVTGAGTDHGG